MDHMEGELPISRKADLIDVRLFCIFTMVILEIMSRLISVTRQRNWSLRYIVAHIWFEGVSLYMKQLKHIGNAWKHYASSGRLIKYKYTLFK